MLRSLIALAVKDLRVLIRNKPALFFTLGWPLLIAIFFGVIFGGGGKGGKLRLALVDEDGSEASKGFAAGLQAADEFETEPLERGAALDRVRQGKKSAAVILPAGFGAASDRLFYGEPPKIELWIDPSHKAESAMLEGLMQRQGARRMSGLMKRDNPAMLKMLDTARRDLDAAGPQSSPGTRRFIDELDRYLQSPAAGGDAGAALAAESKDGWQPVVVESHSAAEQANRPKNAFEFTFPQGILWGLIGCVMSFATALATERTHGTLLRLQASPLPRAWLLLGKGLACLIALLAIQALLLLIGRLVFGIRPQAPLLLLPALLSVALAFTGLMLLIASLGKSEQAVSGAGWAILMPLTMMGGGMVPLFVLPGWMAAASRFSPVRWAILSIEGPLWRGFSPGEMLLPCAILIAVGLLTFALGTRAFRAQG